MTPGLQNTTPANVPTGWVGDAHALWQRGDRSGAINNVLAELNRHGTVKPVKPVLQLTYYLFMLGDPGAAAAFLEATLVHAPRDPE